MKRLLRIAVTTSMAAGLVSGCNTPETALKIQGVVAPDSPTTCLFSADSDTFQGALVYDPARQDVLSLPLKVQNSLQRNTTQFGSEGASDLVETPAAITPLRFDLRWECESNGFSADTGALYLPTFSVETPFCLNRREDTAGAFSGFDVIPASGGAIQPNGGLQIVEIRPITKQLGDAFEDMFNLASRANQCCTDAGSCSNEDLAKAPQSCQDLQKDFDRIAGTNKLSSKSQQDVQLFRPFEQYDFSVRGAPAAGAGPGYPMRLHGILEGLTESGELVTSTELAVEISFCRACRSAHMGCYAF